MNSSSTQAFRYAPLGDDEIRVIILEPECDSQEISASLEATPVKNSTIMEYSALSYTWGDENQPRHSIALANEQFDVRESLFVALQALRNPERPRTLWIDAICIDQNNVDEKQKQLPLMTEIYARAQTVEIWLGPSLGDGELALEALCGGKIVEILTQDIIRALVSLPQREWFERLWTIQELILAAPGAAYVNCGSARYSWDSFAAGLSQILSANDLDAALHVMNNRMKQISKADPSIVELELATLRNQLSTITSNQGMRIFSLQGVRTAFTHVAAVSGADAKPHAVVGAMMRMTRYARATFPGDKVIGLCGLFEEQIKTEILKSSRKSFEEVYFAATSCILRYDSHPNIYHEFPLLNMPTYKVPSWTMDFSFNGSEFAEIAFNSSTQSNGQRSASDKLQLSVDGRELTLEASIVDVIKEVLHQDPIAQIPKTLSSWQQFWIFMLEKEPWGTLSLFGTYDPVECKKVDDSLATLLSLANLTTFPVTLEGMQKFYINMLRDHSDITLPLFVNHTNQGFIKSIINHFNLIHFVERARTLCIRTELGDNDADISPFLQVVLAGLPTLYGKDSGMEIPNDRQLAEDMQTLLGERDDTLPPLGMTNFRKALCHFFDLDEAKAIFSQRFLAARKLAGAIEQVFAPRHSDVRADFFITNSGLCGVSMPGARIGDQVAIIFRRTNYEIPFVLRSAGDKKYLMICAANFSEKWAEMCKSQGTFDPQEVTII